MPIVLDGTNGITTQNVTNSIQPVTASVATNALTVTLNITSLAFRNTPLTSGTINVRPVSAAISVVVPASATLGTVSAVQSRIVVLALDNAGTVELAVVNIAGGTQLDETNLISTTAISSGSTSASVVYSTTARTSLPYRVVGYIESTQATAGTWATTPSTIQGQGGQALAAMSSIGYGQTWQTVSRISGTTYYNTTGRPIMLSVGQATAGVTTFTVTINGSALPALYGSAANAFGGFTIIIPAGATYVYTNSLATGNAAELR